MALNIARALLLVVFYLLSFLFMGALLPVRFHEKEPARLLLVGFFLYYSLFHLVAFPMKLLRLRLHVLSIAWMAVLALCALAALTWRRGVLAESLRSAFKGMNPVRVCYGILVLAVTAVLVLNTNHLSGWDAAHYMGTPTSSVFSDTIDRMNPFSGLIRSGFNTYYTMNTDTAHTAVISQVFGIHPLTEGNLTKTAAFSLIFCLMIWKCGDYLFDRDEKKTGLFSALALLVLLFSYSISGVSHYYAYRTYDGKAVGACLYMTGVLVFFLAWYFRKDRDFGWAGMFLAVMSSAVFCNTTIYLVPLLILALTLPSILADRRWKELRNLAAVLLPGAAWIALLVKL